MQEILCYGQVIKEFVAFNPKNVSIMIQGAVAESMLMNGELTYHLVVVTKYRHKCISKEMLERLKEIANNLLSDTGCEIIKFNGEEDHIHILFNAPPQIQLSKIINTFKTVNSRYIRKEFAQHVSKFYWKPFFWNRSYLILTTGDAPLEMIKQYIENQNSPTS